MSEGTFPKETSPPHRQASSRSSNPSHSNMIARSTRMPIHANKQQQHSQKRRFAVFVKILFRELDRSEDRAELRDIAKSIVLDCTHRNRLGDPAYQPLMEAVDQRLRRHVGEVYWRRAHLYLQHYMKQDALRQGEMRSMPMRTAVV